MRGRVDVRKAKAKNSNAGKYKKEGKRMGYDYSFKKTCFPR